VVPDGPVLLTVRTVAVRILRHACAGDKHLWTGSDRDRPLDATGRRQADVLAGHFALPPVRRIVSSPALRCVQTVEPLARRLGLTVERDPAVDRDGDPDDLRALALALDADDAVICTHGELMRPLLADLRDHGAPVRAAHTDDRWLLAKGTALLLVFGPDGRVGALDHEVPPALPPCPDHVAAPPTA
jgi:broad specificity phosphatase PhoE